MQMSKDVSSNYVLYEIWPGQSVRDSTRYRAAWTMENVTGYLYVC